MKLFFDSSVLVAVFYGDHPHHSSSAKVFLEADQTDFCALHTIGEVYSALTGLPVRPRITALDGIRIVKQIRERLSLITLSEQEYVSVLEQASAGSIVGGAAYDALIARCALNAGAKTLLTWNVRDFTRLGSAVAELVKTPLEI
ncbi:MAG: PIN domain-containing protein [Candidatus Acidiferrales bacterium]